MIALRMLKIAIHKKAQGLGLHVLNIVHDVPEDTFQGWWSRETSSVQPSFLEINPVQKPLEINTSRLISILLTTIKFE